MRSRCVPLLFAMSVFAATMPAQDMAPRIKAEIQRVKDSLKPVKVPQLEPMLKNARELGEGAEQALSDGRVYLSLDKLLQASDLAAGLNLLSEKMDAVNTSMPVFEKEWSATSRTVAAVEAELAKAGAQNAPAAIRAMGETARAKAGPLLEGARGFATSTTPRDGLFYLGEAEAQVRFAQFCSTLRASAPKRGGRSMLPELDALQRKTNAAFKPPLSIDQHSRFIALNSTLKLAEELDAAQLYAGSMYQYLEAVRHYGMLTAAAPDEAAKAGLAERVSEIRRKFEASRRDDSIAVRFLERAPIDDWKSAGVILDQVLPAYQAALRPAATSRGGKPAKTARLTVVRWPYT